MRMLLSLLALLEYLHCGLLVAETATPSCWGKRRKHRRQMLAQFQWKEWITQEQTDYEDSSNWRRRRLMVDAVDESWSRYQGAMVRQAACSRYPPCGNNFLHWSAKFPNCLVFQKALRCSCCLWSDDDIIAAVHHQVHPILVQLFQPTSIAMIYSMKTQELETWKFRPLKRSEGKTGTRAYLTFKVLLCLSVQLIDHLILYWGKAFVKFMWTISLRGLSFWASRADASNTRDYTADRVVASIGVRVWRLLLHSTPAASSRNKREHSI